MSNTHHHRGKRWGREFTKWGRYGTDGTTGPNRRPCSPSMKEMFRRADRRVSRQRIAEDSE